MAPVWFDPQLVSLNLLLSGNGREEEKKFTRFPAAH